MSGFKEWFDSLGWLANAIGIVTPLVGAITIYVKYVHPLIRPPRVASLLKNDAHTTWSNQNAKKIARIAIVDDQLGDFPTSDLRADGYRIDEFTQVSLGEYAALSSYDIVFLDMKGIVRDDPDRGGLELIAELRRRNAKQKICAVSGQTFDPTATAFFRLADDYKKKPLTAQECKQVVDRFLEESMNLTSLVEEADRILATRPRSKRRRAVIAVRDFSNGLVDADRTRHAITSAGISHHDSETFLTLGRVLHHAA